MESADSIVLHFLGLKKSCTKMHSVNPHLLNTSQKVKKNLGWFQNSCTFLNFAANQTVMIALMALQLSAARVLMNVVHLNGRSLS